MPGIKLSAQGGVTSALTLILPYTLISSKRKRMEDSGGSVK